MLNSHQIFLPWKLFKSNPYLFFSHPCLSCLGICNSMLKKQTKKNSPMLPAFKVYCSCCSNICHSLHSRAIKLSGLSEVLLIQCTTSFRDPCQNHRAVVDRDVCSLADLLFLLLPLKDTYCLLICSIESEAHSQNLLFFAWKTASKSTLPTSLPIRTPSPPQCVTSDLLAGALNPILGAIICARGLVSIFQMGFTV